MGDILFLCKLKKCEEITNCCFYINTENFQISDARCSGYAKLPEYEKVITFLKPNEYENIRYVFDEMINTHVLAIIDKAKKELEKLLSNEAEAFFENIILPEEKKWIKENYNLMDADIENIYESYIFEYQDRSIICRIFDSLEDFGKEKAENYISPNNDMFKYINFTKYAEDLISEQPYNFVKTEDGRVVELIY